MKTVKVKIDKKGNAKVELEGFHGVGCQAVTDALKKLGTSHTETNKPEFYESSNSNSISNGF
jgi:hypothetical protein